MMDWSNPHFAEPQWLWLAVLGPLALLLLQWHSERQRKRQLALMACPEALQQLARSHSRLRRALKNALLVVAMACAGLAMARPQWGQLTESGQAVGHDIVFVLDCSQSMLATDVSPNRLERARLAIMDFVRQRGAGRIGLVAFAGQAFTQCPLTFDYDAFQGTLQAIDHKTIPVAGTDIGRALDEAFRATERRPGPKILILMTDGEDLEKGAVRIAETLAAQEVVVFTIGVGTPMGSEIQVLNEQGRQELVRDKNGQVVRSRLDEPTLKQVARVTGGAYHALGSFGEGLMQIQNILNDGNARIGLGMGKKRGVERFHFPLGLMILALVVESLIGTRRLRRDVEVS